MNPHTGANALLQRIAQLEATVVRLSADLGRLRAQVHQQTTRLPDKSAVRTHAGSGKSSTPGHTPGPPTTAHGGLTGALARGEAARVQWVKTGLVVPGEQLAQAWGLTRQALAPAARRGELFAVKVSNRLYYPASFLTLDREAVATICRALGDLGASDKLMFWLHQHGVLAGRTVADALESGLALARLERLATAWARERGATTHGIGRSAALA